MELRTDKGDAVRLHALVKQKPAVLVFYRGNWCPLCVAQLRELASRQEDLTALGAKVILVSP
ncbi:MAG: redoxin domain-containing protein, partial [Aquincola sp.]|nr:redoxin domain-containing protein [Aquincola sp.]